MANQTCNPAVITQALGIQATGPRTVIVPADPIIWDAETSYEYLTLVASTDFGQGYVSKKDVPAGTPLTNAEYWIPVAHFNAQLANISKRVTTLESDFTGLDSQLEETSNRVTTLESDFTEFQKTIPTIDVTKFGADNTGSNDSSAAITAAINSVNGETGCFTLFFPSGSYLISKPIDLYNSKITYVIGQMSTIQPTNNFTGDFLIRMRPVVEGTANSPITESLVSGFRLYANGRALHAIECSSHPRIHNCDFWGATQSEIYQPARSGNDCRIVNCTAKNAADLHQLPLFADLTNDFRIVNTDVWGYDTVLKADEYGNSHIDGCYFWNGRTPRLCSVVYENDSSKLYNSIIVTNTYFDCINVCFHNVGFIVSNCNFFYNGNDTANNSNIYKITDVAPITVNTTSLNDSTVIVEWETWTRGIDLLPVSQYMTCNNVSVPSSRNGDDAYATQFGNMLSNTFTKNKPDIILPSSIDQNKWYEVGRATMVGGGAACCAMGTSSYGLMTFIMIVDSFNGCSCSYLHSLSTPVDKNFFGYRVDGNNIRFYRKFGSSYDLPMITNVLGYNKNGGISYLGTYQFPVPTSLSDGDIKQFKAYA